MTRELLADIARFRDERGWQRYHSPRNLAEAISVEAGELLECVLWDGARFGRGHTDMTDELADVLIFALSMCLVLNVEPETIIRAKMAKNAEKYPVSGQRSDT